MKFIRKQKIQNEAARILEENNTSEAPVNIEKIARNLGISVRKTPAADEISGFLLKQPNGESVIGVNTLHHLNRQRFTIAHEIGHFVLHDLDEIHVDRYVLKLRSKQSSTGEDSQEVEANTLAAELLMPRSFIEHDLHQLEFNDLHDDRAMQHLAKKYQVSVQAMTNRLISLGYISAASFE